MASGKDEDGLRSSLLRVSVVFLSNKDISWYDYSTHHKPQREWEHESCQGNDF